MDLMIIRITWFVLTWNNIISEVHLTWHNLCHYCCWPYVMWRRIIFWQIWPEVTRLEKIIDLNEKRGTGNKVYYYFFFTGDFDKEGIWWKQIIYAYCDEMNGLNEKGRSNKVYFVILFPGILIKKKFDEKNTYNLIIP